MAAIIRLKRKACDEPADGLVLALKKPKCDISNVNEVLFKFATTLNSENESIKDQIQAAWLKKKSSKQTKWQDPKNIAASENTIKKLSEKLRTEHKNSKEKKKLDYLNNRRLILAEEFQNIEDSIGKDAEVRHLFHLYDIIEESEDLKKQIEDVGNIITCNNKPLIREKVDYVFDVYIADRHIDSTFVDGTVSVRPYTLTADDIYSGDSDNSEECYDDDDDSNDENNWRNDYPDEDSHSEKGKDSDNTDSEEFNDIDIQEEMIEAFHGFDIGDDYEEEEDGYEEMQSFDYSRIMKELREEYED